MNTLKRRLKRLETKAVEPGSERLEIHDPMGRAIIYRIIEKIGPNVVADFERREGRPTDAELEAADHLLEERRYTPLKWDPTWPQFMKNMYRKAYGDAPNEADS